MKRDKKEKDHWIDDEVFIPFKKDRVFGLMSAGCGCCAEVVTFWIKLRDEVIMDISKEEFDRKLCNSLIKTIKAYFSIKKEFYEKMGWKL